MKNHHIITPCNFTRVAIRQLLDASPPTTDKKNRLLLIDIRYDISLIELLLRLKTLRSIFPNRRCFFIVDAIRNTLPDHLKDDYIDSNAPLNEVCHKIKLMMNDDRLLGCWEHYATLIRNINLTQAQMRVVREITRGMSTHQIAEKHTLSVKTVYSHANTIKKKLNISTRYNLFHYLYKNTSAIQAIESDIFRKLL
ncbi:hypothetical protein SME22J_08760 [Serratia marcescens]|nr:hypothetical protein SME22J_08760 [Serratia marcescens]